MFDSHFVCLNHSPSAFVHVFSHDVELLASLLIGPCGADCPKSPATLLLAILHDEKRLHNRYLKRRAGCQFNAVDITVT